MGEIPFDTRERNPFHPNKLGLYPRHIESLARGEMIMPITTEVDLTDHGCNQACGHCTFGSGFMQGGIVQINRGSLHKALTEMASLGTRGVEFVGRGEPTVHREAKEIIQDTIELGLDTGLITNGVLLHKVLPIVDRLRYVRVSLDSANPATYRQLHGLPESSTHHQRVLENIRAVKNQMTSAQHDDMALGIGYLVVPPYNHTEAEIRDAVELANKYWVDYVVFRPAQLRQDIDPKVWIDAQKIIRKVREENEGNHTKILCVAGIRWDVLDIEKHPTGLCESRPVVAVIKANGDIPHCILYRNDETLILGNINQQSFGEIWGSEENQQRLREFEISGCPSTCKHFRYNEIIRNNVVFSQPDLQDIGHPNHL